MLTTPDRSPEAITAALIQLNARRPRGKRVPVPEACDWSKLADTGAKDFFVLRSPPALNRLSHWLKRPSMFREVS